MKTVKIIIAFVVFALAACVVYSNYIGGSDFDFVVKCKEIESGL